MFRLPHCFPPSDPGAPSAAGSAAPVAQPSCWAGNAVRGFTEARARSCDHSYCLVLLLISDCSSLWHLIDKLNHRNEFGENLQGAVLWVVSGITGVSSLWVRACCTDYKLREGPNVFSRRPGPARGWQSAFRCPGARRAGLRGTAVPEPLWGRRRRRERGVCVVRPPQHRLELCLEG